MDSTISWSFSLSSAIRKYHLAPRLLRVSSLSAGRGESNPWGDWPRRLASPSQLPNPVVIQGGRRRSARWCPSPRTTGRRTCSRQARKALAHCRGTRCSHSIAEISIRWAAPPPSRSCCCRPADSSFVAYLCHGHVRWHCSRRPDAWYGAVSQTESKRPVVTHRAGALCQCTYVSVCSADRSMLWSVLLHWDVPAASWWWRSDQWSERWLVGAARRSDSIPLVFWTRAAGCDHWPLCRRLIRPGPSTSTYNHRGLSRSQSQGCFSL